MFKLEHRAVIKFLTKESTSPKTIKTRLDKIYGDASPSYTTVKHWSKLFREGRDSIEDDPRGGSPSTVLIEKNIKLVKDIVQSDRRIKANKIAEISGISKTSVLRILHEHLNMSKVYTKWVPQILTAIQKRQRLDWCKTILQEYGQNKDTFFTTIVTGAETLVLYYNPIVETDSIECPKKSKVMQSSQKIMATVFWDMKGILLIDFLEDTLNAVNYTKLLNQLQDAIIEKREGTEEVCFLHDNKQFHTAMIKKSAEKKCIFKESFIAAYSPDLNPCDYFLFSQLKYDLRGSTLNTADAVKSAILEHFENKSPEYFSTGIEKLIKQCEKCIKVNGDYIEKQ